MVSLKELSRKRKLKNAAANKAKDAADAAAAADATAVAVTAAASAAAATATDAASRAAAVAITPVARLLITVLKGYCFRGQIHSIPPQYSWSNLFQFSSCQGSKNGYCFQHEDSNTALQYSCQSDSIPQYSWVLLSRGLRGVLQQGVLVIVFT